MNVGNVMNIRERASNMALRPEMWAVTVEAFAIQLVMLAEIGGIDSRTASTTILSGLKVDELRSDIDWNKAQDIYKRFKELLA